MLQTLLQYNDFSQKMLQKILNLVPNLSRKGCATAGWNTKLAEKGDRVVVQGAQECGNPSLHFPVVSALFYGEWLMSDFVRSKCKRLKPTFPGFVLKVASFPEDVLDRVLITYPCRFGGRDRIFHTFCVSALVSAIPVQKAHPSQAQATDSPPASRSCSSPSLWDPENPNLSSAPLCCSGIFSLTEPKSVSEQSRELMGSGRMWLISPYKSTDEAALGLSLLSLTSFGFCQLCWLMLSQQPRHRLQRQMGKCHSWQTKKEKKIVFLSFLMHWSVWLLQETLSPFTMNQWEQHSTNSTAREILSLALQKNYFISQQCHWLLN